MNIIGSVIGRENKGQIHGSSWGTLQERATPDTLVEKSALTVTMVSFLRTVCHALLARINQHIFIFNHIHNESELLKQKHFFGLSVDMEIFLHVNNSTGILFHLGLSSHAFQWIEASFLTGRLLNKIKYLFYCKRIVHSISAIFSFFFFPHLCSSSVFVFFFFPKGRKLLLCLPYLFSW